MKALVLEEKGKLIVRDFELNETLGEYDVRVAPKFVGICASDIHYYQYGKIGPYVVTEPFILGHEASGMVIETGSKVTTLKVGDRVCMEPGIPDPNSFQSRMGKYNLDPSIRFWATPPYHGVLRESFVHPENYTFKLADNVSLEEGSLIEPIAIGLWSANKAEIKPGDTAVVIGAGTIGIVTAMSALAGGCSKVIITDIMQSKLNIAANICPVIPLNAADKSLTDQIIDITDGYGADIVFECSGYESAAEKVFDYLKPGGRVIFVGIPHNPIQYDVIMAQIKEARVEHVFRYAFQFPRVAALIASGKINVKPLISRIFPFDEGSNAFDFAVSAPEGVIKVLIDLRKL